MKPYFQPELFKFLLELKNNNKREWFAENKNRYEQYVKNPMLKFIVDFAPHLKKINADFIANPKPVGGSLFRIYKDARFSKDKAPYKTHVAAHFRHKVGKDVHAPGFYLHLEHQASLGGGGIWCPDSGTLTSIRDYIVGNPKAFQSVKNKCDILSSTTLSRAPRGYDIANKFIEDLKRKDYYVSHKFSEKQVCSAEFMNLWIESCTKTNPLISFLDSAIGLS